MLKSIITACQTKTKKHYLLTSTQSNWISYLPILQQKPVFLECYFGNLWPKELRTNRALNDFIKSKV